MDRCDSLKDMHQIVDDRETYTTLNRDLFAKYKKELEVIVDTVFRKGILNDKERLFLVSSAPHTRVIYYLPKIHKD